MPTPARDNKARGDDEKLAENANRSDIARTTILLVALWMLIAWSLIARSKQRAVQPALAEDVAVRLDPNSAPWTELAALPGLGPGLARRIIAYRENYAREHDDPLPFREPKDLEDVRGIGPKRSAQLAPFLAFPPNAQPSPPESAASSAGLRPPGDE